VPVTKPNTPKAKIATFLINRHLGPVALGPPLGKFKKNHNLIRQMKQ